MIRHPGFDPDLLLNDVTLLRLATPVVAPTIDLLPPERAALAQPPGAGLIAGYGLIRQDPMEQLAPTLYAGRIRLMTDRACRREWHGDFDRSVMFCAGPVGTRTAETVHGDSGGPLLVVDPADHRTLPGRLDVVRGGGLPGVVEHVRAALELLDPQLRDRTAGLRARRDAPVAVSHVHDTATRCTRP